MPLPLAHREPFSSARPSSGRSLLLACGNTLRGDDGVGWAIGTLLEEAVGPAKLEVILTQQLLPEHAEFLSMTETVIFVDCSAVTAAGTISTITIDAAPELPRILTHHLDPAALLRMALDLYGKAPAKAVAVTVGGASFELGEGLSPTVEAAIPAAVGVVLGALGIGRG